MEQDVINKILFSLYYKVLCASGSRMLHVCFYVGDSSDVKFIFLDGERHKHFACLLIKQFSTGI